MDSAAHVVDGKNSIVHAYIFCLFYMGQTPATGGVPPCI